MTDTEPVNRYEQALRDLVAHLDYDAFKQAEGDEDGVDKFPAMAKQFAAAVDAPAAIDIVGTLVPIEDIAKMLAGELEGQTNLVAPNPGYLEWHLDDDASIDGHLIHLNAEVARIGSEATTAGVTLVLRVESVTVR